MSNKSSKIIKIERATSFTHEANEELKDWFGQSARAVGSYFKKNSTKPGSGLTFEEENLLLPSIVNLPPTDRDFRKEVEKFYTDITTKIPDTGRMLEIGLMDNTKELGEKLEDGNSNLPINIEDYLRWKHAISHPQVSDSEFTAAGNQLIFFYIKDAQHTAEVKKKETDTRDKAMAKYLTIKSNEDLVDKVLTNLGIETRHLNSDERILKLKEKAEAKAIEAVEHFIAIVDDKDIDNRWRINKMISANILYKVGTRILIKENNKEIGRDMKEALLWIADKENSETVQLLKARYREFAGLATPTEE